MSLESRPLQINVKCDPEKALELRDKFPGVKPGYHMNKKHWNTISCDERLSEKLVYEWIMHSFQLVLNSLPAKTRRTLGYN